MSIPPDPLPASPSSTRRGFWLAWAGFCALMLLMGLQEVFFDGKTRWRWPLFDEVLALSIATGVAVWRWRGAPRHDGLLDTPRAWFGRAVLPLLWLAPAFVLVLYGVRHGARALLGETYAHAPWPLVLGYESAKFAVFYLLLTGVLFGLRSRQALAAERLRAARLEQLSMQARLEQLTQQVQPHFLFNALNTIGGLLHEDPRAADAALMRLAGLMRAASDASARPQHGWADELLLARHYAELMTQRFGSRVQLAWHDDPAAAGCTVPAMSVQPLLENAFVHGVERHRGRVNIELRAERQGSRLRVCVSNDAGALPDVLAEGVGLGNLRQRLAVLYGNAASLTLAGRPGGGVEARLELPV